MSRSYWNDIDRRNNGDIQEAGDRVEQEYQNRPSHPRYYPTPSMVLKSSSSHCNYSSVLANKAAESTNGTPQTSIETADESCLPFVAKASSSCPPAAMTWIESNSDSSSFYETLRAEAAFCCPLCGFQKIDAARGFLPTGTLPSDSRVENKLRSFVIQQQDNLLNGCGPSESSNELPSGTCWVCIQAKAAKEKQVEEDRMLAASLSKILLEEQQQNRSTAPPLHHNSIHTNGTNYNTNNSLENFALSYHDPNTGNSIPQYRHPGTLKRNEWPEERLIQPEEWPEERHESTHTSSLSPEMERKVEEGTNDDPNGHQSTTTTAMANTGTTIGNQDANDQTNATVIDDTCVYIGEYNILGQRHGSRGELIWDSGDRYVGTFKNGMRSGQGAFFFRDGSEYTGDWKENLMHGFGQCKFANGDTYVGQYFKGQKSGENCKYKFSNSDLYVGRWVADRFHGFGRYFYADGSVLEGTFCHGLKQGKFKRQLPNEDLDILRFEEDRLVGQGVRWNTKRTKTWLLVLRNDENAIASKKKTCVRRMVRSIGNLCRTKKSADYVPSPVGVSETRESDNANDISSSVSLLASSPSSPHENLVPVLPQGLTKNMVKKSVRIPISRAVSIGYDCEIGTGARAGPVAVK